MEEPDHVVQRQDQDEPEPETIRDQVQQQQPQQETDHEQEHESFVGESILVNISISDSRTQSSTSAMREDVWSCLVVLVTFWCFASMTLIFGFYGSVNLQLGPNCSRLIQLNSFFVKTMQAQFIQEAKPGPILYGFYKPPKLDMEIKWNEAHEATVPVEFHQEWVYFLNEGSSLEISYSVESPSSLPLALVIAQGRESLVEWIDDPSYPNTTLSWNIIYGSGMIHQKIYKLSNYYIAVGNLNSEEVKVEMNFTVTALVYNTSQAYSRCFIGNHLCSLKLFFLGTGAAVLTSPRPEEVALDGSWFIKLSYGPRWLTYFVGSGIMTMVILLVFRSRNKFQTASHDEENRVRENIRPERVPLLSHKDDDNSSQGSSYDSISQDEKDLEEAFGVRCSKGISVPEAETISRLCVICFDAPRDCFFLPCGHCAACFACGTRISEEAGNCPVCRRTMKKVRKIFTV